MNHIATILRANSPLTKAFRRTAAGEWVKTSDIPRIREGWTRQPFEIPNDIEKLAVLLRPLPANAAVTLSIPTGSIPLDKPARRLARGSEATLTLPDVTTLFVLDLDGYPLTEPLDTNDPRGAIGEVLDKLGLADYSTVWQLTSGARHGSLDLRARLYFLTETPIPPSILADAAEVLGADRALYHPAQIIYTAPPVFAGGADPIPERWGVILGTADTVPPSILHDLAAENARRPSPGEYAGEHHDVPRMGFHQVLGYLGDGEGLRGFHEPLLRYTLLAVRRKLKRDTIKTICRAAIAAAPRKPSRPQSDIARYMSDAYLDDIIQGAHRIVKESDTLPPRHTTHAAPDPIPLAEAEARVREVIGSYIKDPTKTAVLKVTVGAGKTHAAVEAINQWLAENPVGNVVWFAPTHNQAIEVEAKLNEAAPGTALRIRGRLPPNFVNEHKSGLTRQDDEADPPLCGRPDVVAAASAAGFGKNIKSLCCETIVDGEKFHCPLWNECQYYAQFRAKHRVRIVPHEMLKHPTAAVFSWDGWGDDVQLVIVDESPLNVITGHAEKPLDKALELGGAFAAALQHVINKTTPDDGEALAERIEAQAAEEMVETIPGVGASQGDEALIELFAEHELKRNPKAAFAHLAERLAAWCRGESNSVWIGKEKGKDIVLYAWKNSPAWLQKALVLDATAHEEIYRAALDTDIEFHEINVQQNLYTIQINDAVFSKNQFRIGKNQSHDAKLVTQLAGLATVFNAGLITHKTAVEDLAEKHPNHAIPTAHFMALRGINALQDLPALIVAGRIEPPPLTVEARARALWPREKLDLTGGYEWQQGEHGGVAGHRDARIDAVLRDIREGEMLQAIGRLRAVRSATPKLLIVATNVNCPIKPDMTLTAEELLPDHRAATIALRDGVFIASENWLSARHPDLFDNPQQVRDWARKGWFSLNKKFYIRENHPLNSIHPIQFRLEGQRGSLAKAITWQSETATRQLIETLTGRRVTAYAAETDIPTPAATAVTQPQPKEQSHEQRTDEAADQPAHHPQRPPGCPTPTCQPNRRGNLATGTGRDACRRYSGP